MADTRSLAQIVVEGTSVSLYYHGEAEPERLDLTKVPRVTISLRDVDGPCVWVDPAEEEPEPPAEEPPASGPDH